MRWRRRAVVVRGRLAALRPPVAAADTSASAPRGGLPASPADTVAAPAAPSTAPGSSARGVQDEIARRRAATSPPARCIAPSRCWGCSPSSGICWLLSRDRPAVPWRLVVWGLALQLLFGFFVLKTAPGYGSSTS